MTDSLQQLLQRFPELEVCRPQTEAALQLFVQCYCQRKKTLLCGNGGSAADAEHWAGELLKGFVRKRPLPPEWEKKVSPRLAQGLQDALPAIPLTSFPSLQSAFANDADPQLNFAQLLWGLGKPGDLLVGLSTSGNSSNVLHAFELARAMEIQTLALTGKDGGKLKTLADVAICAPAEETYRIQEYHLALYHWLALETEAAFFPE